jgi:hypothetical protein
MEEAKRRRGRMQRRSPISSEKPRGLGEEARMNLEKARRTWDKISNKP